MAKEFARELMRGSLDLMVLSALVEEPKYGYLIQKQLGQASDGALRLQAGTLYPLLHRMESDGLIRAKWDKTTGRRRKWYELTAAGRRRLAAQADQWSRYVDCISRMLAPVLEASPRPAPKSS